MQNQNPENYAVRKGIARDRIEKHMQGVLLSLLIYRVCFDIIVLINAV